MVRATILTLLLVAPLAQSAEPKALSVKSHNNLTFAKIGDEKLLLDLSVPDSPGPHPLVVCIHGGAWKLGNRFDLAWSICGDTIIEEMNKAGYATATIEYRLAPKHKFPAQIVDCKTAVRFLRANAEKYNLDPNRIGALGFSAGAHLACLLGTTGPDAGFDGTLYPDVSSSVNCVLDYFGPSDLTLYSKAEGIRDSYMVPLLGKDATKSLDVYKKASPITYVSKDSVPTLIVHGTFDVMVPVIHAERYRDKLKAEGVPVDTLFLTGRLHGWRHEDTKITDAKGIEFLNKYLKPVPVK